MNKSLNIVILASGQGSNAEAIINSIEAGELQGEVVLIISNKKTPGVSDVAKQRGIQFLYLNPDEYPTEKIYTQTLIDVLSERGTELVVLAGYLKKIPREVTETYRNKIMNIHPALLPSFGGKGMYGMKIHAAVIDYGVKITGVTVHFVDDKYDHGPIILQKAAPVMDDDTPETLAQRILQIEHELYPEAIRCFQEGRIRVIDRKVSITGIEG